MDLPNLEDQNIVKELMNMMAEEDMIRLNSKIASSLVKKGIKIREFKWIEYEAS